MRDYGCSEVYDLAAEDKSDRDTLLSTEQQASAREKVTKLCDIPMQITVQHDEKSKTCCSIEKEDKAERKRVRTDSLSQRKQQPRGTKLIMVLIFKQ
eukprot:15314383-Ditylum_brightwellii.AAC.1